MHSLLSLITWALPWNVAAQCSLNSGTTELENPGGIPTAIPGGSPFSYCDVSRPTDLSNISSITLWPQPLHINEDFTVTMYGEFSQNITANSTMNFWLDCGSHCEEYGPEPGSGEGDSIDFCDVTFC